MKRSNSTQLGGLDPILMTAKTRRVGVGVEGRRINSGEHLLRQELKEKGDGERGGGGGGDEVFSSFLSFSSVSHQIAYFVCVWRCVLQ